MPRILGNRALVRKIDAPTTAGGIYLPESARDDHNVGGPKVYEVMGVGPGAMIKGRRRPLECQPGDRVICQSYLTGPIELEHDHLIITGDQILAIIPKATHAAPE